MAEPIIQFAVMKQEGAQYLKLYAAGGNYSAKQKEAQGENFGSALLSVLDPAVMVGLRRKLGEGDGNGVA